MAVMELDTKKAFICEDVLKDVSCRYTSEALREAISHSEEDFRKGRVHTIEEIRSKFPKP
ncbi:hypothetical protein FACS189451_10330 [Bacteroidia bacterium]|nr:hypothetical protein FACS189451_10330 [Bacteroidia bacterium]